MLLTITLTRPPATDLGWLLHKHPERVQTFELAFGKAHVYYPESGDERCTAALLLDVDPIGLVRRGPHAAPLDAYVNDRPYVASSFLSVAIAQVLGSALSGKSKRPELVEEALPLEARLATLPCRGRDGGQELLRRLFAPLGYEIAATQHPLDERFPQWGEGRLWDVRLRGRQRLQDLLAHLYVLVPVLDNDKHYWIEEAEIDKLLRHGQRWLASHPERDWITGRYLKNQRRLTQSALAQMRAEETASDPAADDPDAEEAGLEQQISLNDLRLRAVVEAIVRSGARSVVDLGCGEGKLLEALLPLRQLTRLAGVDVSVAALSVARRRLKLDARPVHEQGRVSLLHGSLVYRDPRLAGFDAATCVEVVEHLDPPRLAAFERGVFELARPRTVVLTTPNVEFNARFPWLPASRLRHKDHRFEWTRQELRQWAERVGARFGYHVELRPVGPEDPEVGAPTQMGVFTRG